MTASDTAQIVPVAGRPPWQLITILLNVCLGLLAHTSLVLATDRIADVRPTIRIPADGERKFAAFSTDGSILVVVSWRGRIEVIDSSDGHVIRRGQTYKLVSDIALSPDNKTVCVATFACGGPIVAISTEDGATARTLKWPDRRIANRVRCAPAGDWVAVTIEAHDEEKETEDDVELFLWNYKTGEKLEWPYMHTRRMNSIAFSPDGKRLATASEDHTVCEWTWPQGKLLSTFEGHDAAVRSVAYSPDGQRIVSGDADSRILIWDVNTKKKLGELGDRSESDGFVQFIRGGDCLVSCNGTDAITFSNPKTLATIGKLRTGQEHVFEAHFAKNDSLMATVGGGGSLCFWNVDEVMSKFNER